MKKRSWLCSLAAVGLVFVLVLGLAACGGSGDSSSGSSGGASDNADSADDAAEVTGESNIFKAVSGKYLSNFFVLSHSEFIAQPAA